MSYVYSWGTQIDAGTDVQGVNTVDIVFTWGEAWEHSDESGWHFIASDVQSISWTVHLANTKPAW